jgi:D-alanyl-lipoteichoic acid acyltransferase DltB (MBOAT superfamily)
MLFNSLEFALFFPLVCVVFFLSPQKIRVHVLLAASCIFYMAFIPSYILILAVTILIDYVGGILIERKSPGQKKIFLWISVLATCAVLFIFKYYDFFWNNFSAISAFFGQSLARPASMIILPIGLSFHTFQSLSYVIEVYCGRQKAERNFVTYATYVMFFPQLVAGPIERPQNLLHQFREFHDFNYARVTAGLKRMAWGFFKKLVVADRIALYVNDVYGDPRSHSGPQLVIATLLFAYQIYCDFSGYSDIALGSARVLGFNLMENFDRPYHAHSTGDFWRRWHISLSTWFKDYVYVPLGGSRVGPFRWGFNVLVTFGISGLWHGANWTYVFWGLLNGLYLIVGRATERIRASFFAAIGLAESNLLRRWIRTFTTFGLVLVAWVLFRADSINDAAYIFTHCSLRFDISALSTEQFGLRQFPVTLIAIAILEFGESQFAKKLWNLRFAPAPMPIRWVGYLAFCVSVILLGVYRRNQFIYFQF